MGILPRTATSAGASCSPIRRSWATTDILKLQRDGPEIRALRGSRIGMIFQEPMSSLSPLHTIGNQIGEALQLHTAAGKAERRERTDRDARPGRLPQAAARLDMYPFELSGGLRQRAMIAMALICQPALLIADEPTTALDVTIQAQILQLMRDLQAKMGMAMLLITHDLGVVANMADEVVVIYHGEIMEAGPVEDIFRAPEPPLSQGPAGGRAAFRHEARRAPQALREVPVDAAALLGKKTASREHGVEPARRRRAAVGARPHANPSPPASRAGSARAPKHRCAPSTMSASTSGAANASAWSAKAAAARPPSARSSMRAVTPDSRQRHLQRRPRADRRARRRGRGAAALRTKSR